MREVTIVAMLAVGCASSVAPPRELVARVAPPLVCPTPPPISEPPPGYPLELAKRSEPEVVTDARTLEASTGWPHGLDRTPGELLAPYVGTPVRATLRVSHPCDPAPDVPDACKHAHDHRDFEGTLQPGELALEVATVLRPIAADRFEVRRIGTLVLTHAFWRRTNVSQTYESRPLRELDKSGLAFESCLPAAVDTVTGEPLDHRAGLVGEPIVLAGPAANWRQATPQARDRDIERPSRCDDLTRSHERSVCRCLATKSAADCQTP